MQRRLGNAADRGSTLPAGGVLHVGDYLRSPSGHFCAVLQDNGDLSVYRGLWPDRMVGPMWWTGSGRDPGHYPPNVSLKLESNGNLVVYSGNTSLWQSGSPLSGSQPATASMQDDGNFTLAVPGKTYWSTGTNRGAIFVHNSSTWFTANVHTTGDGDTGNMDAGQSRSTTWPLDTQKPQASFFSSGSRTPFKVVDLGTLANQRYRVTGSLLFPGASAHSGFGPF